MMRIITGSARGTRLLSLDGDATRPTSERVKEAVFSMIQFELEGRRVLDLFGGCGQLALEALSRGANSALICDSNAEAVKIIKENAKKTHLYEKCVILTADALRMIKNSKEKFSLIFIDPPYASDLAVRALRMLAEQNMISDKGIVILETSQPIDEIPDSLKLRREARYSKTYITVLEKEADEK
ncbi:MAG: 16S rRNA (guanine(966)-N(2))-methyltransferase RsmD [Clostridia bacterium]|nr:16S rRNA (guanine(966)-N(2))-methyltransferase RsmD [Clostridia bacterium]